MKKKRKYQKPNLEAKEMSDFFLACRTSAVQCSTVVSKFTALTACCKYA